MFSLEEQRKTYFAASLVALATAAVILVSAWQTSNARIVMIVAALAAAWIVLFSTVDIVKEAGRSRWWSISTCLFSAATLTLASYMLIR